MGTLLELISTFATPFMQHPQIVLVLAILIVGADAGIWTGGDTAVGCPMLDGSSMSYEEIRNLYYENPLNQITYESAVANPNLVIKRSVSGYYVTPLVIDTGWIIPDTGIGWGGFDRAVYIASPDCKPYSYFIIPSSAGAGAPNAFGGTITAFLQYLRIPIPISSFWLFVLMIFSTVGFWALKSLT